MSKFYELSESIRRQRAQPSREHAAFVAALTAQRDALRAENARLREALESVCDATHHDGVNGHLLKEQNITREGIAQVYETARAALAAKE